MTERMGRPPFQPSPRERSTVKTMAAFGVPLDAMARSIGICPNTLRKHFAQELMTGSADANAKVAEALFKKATGNGPQSIVAAIFWLKARAGWRDRPEAEGDGMKAQQLRAAEAAAVGRFATPPPPLAYREDET